MLLSSSSVLKSRYVSAFAIVALLFSCSDNKQQNKHSRKLNAVNLASKNFTATDLDPVPGGLADKNASLIPLLGDEGKILYGKTIVDTRIVTNVETQESFSIAAGSVVELVAQNGDFVRAKANVSTTQGVLTKVEGFIPADHVDDKGMENYTEPANSAESSLVIRVDLNTPGLKDVTNASNNPIMTSLDLFNQLMGIAGLAAANANSNPNQMGSLEHGGIPSGQSVTLQQGNSQQQMPNLNNGMTPADGSASLQNEIASGCTGITINTGSGSRTSDSSNTSLSTKERRNLPGSVFRDPKGSEILLQGKAHSWRLAMTVTNAYNSGGSTSSRQSNGSNKVGGAQTKLNEVFGPKDFVSETYASKVPSTSPSVPSDSSNAKSKGYRFVNSSSKVESVDGTRIPLADLVTQNSWFGGDRSIVAQGLDAAGNPIGAKCQLDIGITSPVVLDFSGSEMIASKSIAESNVTFDLDADGVAEATGWIDGSTAAFLALDLNGNGKIDNGLELFGTATEIANTKKSAENGFLALTQHDKNNDGKIDKNDAIFKKLVLWFDRNHNGRSESSELVSLNRQGVSAIAVGYTEVDRKLALQHNETIAPNDVRFQSRFWGTQCPTQGCRSYDIFFGVLSSKVVSR